MLQKSLVVTLDAYPQLAGQLQRAPYDSKQGGHTQRYGRLMLAYNTSTDPGVEFVVAHSSHVLASLVPDAESRRSSGSGGWDAGCIGALGLVPTEPKLALHDLQTCAGLPCVIVQVTTFTCGGIGVTIQFAHPVADAQALVQFARDWARTNRAMSLGAALPVLEPVFDPQRLDAAAAGNVDADSPDMELVAKAQKLPMHRYDWWVDASGQINDENVPDVLKASPLLEPPGKAMPWHEWDRTAPIVYASVYFEPSEVQGIYRAACAHAKDGVRISRLDALLAHIWSVIVRARGLPENDDGDVHMDITMGLRARLNPRLPDTFMGSPLLLTHATLRSRTVANSSPDTLGLTATTVRSVMAQFTPGALAAFLHASCFASCPQRYWDGFLGTRHIMVTSWLRLGVYDVDFGFGEDAGTERRARYVDAFMPDEDGLVHVVEAGEVATGDEAGTKPWYDEPVCMNLRLAADVMKRVLDDPGLHMYTNKELG
jgi:hypothetical protein